MASMYVLDTNTLIYFFKGMGNVSSRLLMNPPASIAIPTIVLFELEVGIAKSSSPKKRLRQLESLASTVTILPLGHAEVKAAASIRADLERQGKPIGPYDVLIAGTALAARGILVTHNTREFERIKGLQVEDWY
jgi:tRNA(fMet)-specific endonuclease VapC